MAISPPAQEVPSTDGVRLALHDLGGDGPPVLLCHPTGFLGATWGPVAAELGGRAHSWALDFRGHGESSGPVSGDYRWTGMADDVLAVVDELGLTGVRAAGHSMGGAALLMAEQRRPGTFAALWLFEPIVFPPGRERLGPNPMADIARRRRPRFPDRAAAYANFSSKPPMNTLTPAALQAYVDHGLRDTGHGDEVALACTPEVEARVFDGGLRHSTFAVLPQVACPVTVAASGDADGPAQTAPAVVDALPRGTLERHDTLTHFGPMEDPPTIATAIADALGIG
jgi:pimeloyl-ACP methyl ester carboxylesterase